MQCIYTMKYANFGALVTFLANAVLIPTLLLSQFIVILLCLDRFTVRQYKYLMSRIIDKAGVFLRQIMFGIYLPIACLHYSCIVLSYFMNCCSIVSSLTCSSSSLLQ